MIFEWDAGNRSKNLMKHGIRCEEIEECFDDEPVIYRDFYHSEREERYICLGKTGKGRLLFIVFTLREEKVRVISARPANQKERSLYHEKRT